MWVRIKAFTLVELIVVMILSSIVIGIIYYVFTNVQHNFLYFKDYQGKISSIAQLDATLNRDIIKSDHVVVKKDNLLHCRLGKEVIKYQFNNEIVVRTQRSRIDTFSIQHQFKFTQISNTSLVDKVLLTIHERGKQIQMNYKKEYGMTSIFESLTNK